MSGSRLVNYLCKRCNCNSRRGVGFWIRSSKIYTREEEQTWLQELKFLTKKTFATV